MNTVFAPSPRAVRGWLTSRKLAEVRALADHAGVPFQTVYNIRAGKVLNPRIGTVHALANAINSIATPKA